MNENAFSSLQIRPSIGKSLASLGYDQMTPIQAQSLPHILAGTDVIAHSKTGSGKTAAFALGILEKLDSKHFQVQTLVLCPTRELAEQVSNEVRSLARGLQNIKLLTLCGGTPLRPQADSLQHGAHIVVGTPGRIDDHLAKGTLVLASVNTLVLDEADRMLEMGFKDTLEAIIGKLPKQRQTLLFSATYPEKIQAMVKQVMHKPVTVKVDHEHNAATIEQHFYKISSNEEREKALRLLLLHFQPETTLVFCNTKKETTRLAKALSTFGFSAMPIHGDLEQKDRDHTLIQFANNSVAVLVATDVAARGLDIESIDMVVNYQLAQDPEVHTHRIGRIGRAGKNGVAHTLYAAVEQPKLALIIGYQPKGESLPASAGVQKPAHPPKRTIQIDGGKKQKVRAGDILGALTSDGEIAGSQVGKINLSDNRAFVAVNREVAKHALKKLSEGKLKGKTFRVRFIGN